MRYIMKYMETTAAAAFYLCLSSDAVMLLLRCVHAAH